MWARCCFLPFSDSLCVSLPLAHFIGEDAFAPAEDLEPATTKYDDTPRRSLPDPRSADTDYCEPLNVLLLCQRMGAARRRTADPRDALSSAGHRYCL